MEILLVLLMIGAGVLAVPVALVRLSHRLDTLTARLADLERRFAGLAPAAATRAIDSPEPRAVPFPAPSVAPTATVAAAPAIPTASAVLAAPTALEAADLPPEAASPREPATPPAPEWEVIVGTSWLNKVGVLVLLLGLGFLLAYSFAHLGAGGRIALGYATGGGLLGAGVKLSRRDGYRVYGQGLIAGGWAGLYLTTFAAHGVPASRVIESDLIASLALLTVSTGMIWHALRFGSLPTTALAYVSAYATLALSAASAFSTAAAVPLTASVLVVAVRAGWPSLAMLGLALTFGLFGIREQTFPATALDPAEPARYLALGVFWLLFETADLLDRSRRMRLGIANAAGFVGVSLLQMPSDPAVIAGVAGAAGLAILVSAIVRYTWTDVEPRREAEADDTRFTAAHASVAMASGLFAWTALVLFDPLAEALAILLVAELLISAGLSLGDVVIRRIGLAAAVLATTAVWSLVTGRRSPAPEIIGLTGASAVGLLTAAAWYVNDTLLRRALSMHPLERSYGWSAYALVLMVIWRWLPLPYLAPGTLVFAAVLLERSRSVAEDFRVEAAIATVLGALLVVPAFVFESDRRSVIEVWTILPSIMALCLWLARRVQAMLGPHGLTPHRGHERLWSGTMTVAAIGVLAVLERHVLPEGALAAAWALTAIAPAILGRRLLLPGLVEGAAALLLLASGRALWAIAEPGAAGWPQALDRGVVALVLFGASASLSTEAGRRSSLDQACAVIATSVGTVLLTLLTFDELRAGLLTTAWGVEGLVLLSTGFLVRARPLRLAGLAMLLVCLIKLFGYDLNELEPLARILSFVGLGLVLLVVSWIYTTSARRSR